MKVAVLSEYRKLDFVDMVKPQHGEDELLIRVQACGICESDVHGYDEITGGLCLRSSWGMKLRELFRLSAVRRLIFSPAVTLGPAHSLL
jgi:hypothetical protein